MIDLSGCGAEDGIGYSLSLSSINEYKHLELKINTSVEFYRKASPDPILNANRNMTLYDVIRAILYEITFYGSPKNRTLVKDELEKISNSLEPTQSITFAELFNNIKDDLDDVTPV